MILQKSSSYFNNPNTFLLTVIHGLRTPGEEIAFTARPKINSHSQIFRYGRSIFCLPHGPKISDFFDLCLHWLSVVRTYVNEIQKRFNILSVPSSVQVHLPAYELDFLAKLLEYRLILYFFGFISRFVKLTTLGRSSYKAPSNYFCSLIKGVFEHISRLSQKKHLHSQEKTNKNDYVYLWG